MDKNANNLRLIENLQQNYQPQNASEGMLENAKRRIIQRLDKRILQSANSQFFQSETSFSSKSTRKISQGKRQVRHSCLLVAILLIGLLSLGTASFVIFHFSSSSVGYGLGGFNIVGEPQPVLYQHNLYVVSSGNISTYAVQDGSRGRTYKLANIESSAFTNGILYASTLSVTYAMQISDGKLLWQAPFGSNHSNPPEIVNGVLYGSTATDVYALHTSDGKLLWRYHTENRDESFTSPVIAQGMVCFTSTVQNYQKIDARAYALSMNNGKLIWEKILGHSSISSLKTDGTALYGFVDGSIIALQGKDGKILWQHQLASLSLLEMHHTMVEAVTNGVVSIAAGDGVIYGLQAAHGIALWNYRVGRGTLFSSFSIDGGVLYFGILPFSTPNAPRVSSIVALQANDGHRIWQYQMGEQEMLSPNAEQGVIYVIALANNHGQQALYALRADNTALIWQHTLLF